MVTPVHAGGQHRLLELHRPELRTNGTAGDMHAENAPWAETAVRDGEGHGPGVPAEPFAAAALLTLPLGCEGLTLSPSACSPRF